MPISTADISDQLGDKAIIAAPGFRCFGRRAGFSGKISTVRCYEDNSLVRTALGEPAGGRILVVDGGASMNCALLGDMLATLAADNDWQGVIVNGCIRDSQVIDTVEREAAGCSAAFRGKNDRRADNLVGIRALIGWLDDGHTTDLYVRRRGG